METHIADTFTPPHILKEAKELVDCVIKIDQAFERVKIELGGLDFCAFHAKPVEKLQPQWVGFQRRFIDLVWKSNTVARQTGAYVKEFVNVILPSLADLQGYTEYRDAAADLLELALRNNPFEDLVGKGSAQPFNNLLCDIKRFRDNFELFLEEQGTTLDTDIVRLQEQISELAWELKHYGPPMVSTISEVFGVSTLIPEKCSEKIATVSALALFCPEKALSLLVDLPTSSHPIHSNFTYISAYSKLSSIENASLQYKDAVTFISKLNGYKDKIYRIQSEIDEKKKGLRATELVQVILRNQFDAFDDACRRIAQLPAIWSCVAQDATLIIPDLELSAQVSNDGGASHKMRMDSFVDMKIEELLSVNSGTANGRAIVHEYIQDQIKAHKSIIRYYKGRLNALTVTCRIPSEILACIFGQLVEDATVADNDVACPPFIYWIKAAAHVCSHWREIALSTPSLWSTIYPDLLHQTWTLEMLKHSKDVPLSVISWDCLSQKAYPLLKQILSRHLPRIKTFVIGVVAPWTFNFPHNGPTIGLDGAHTLLQLLDQHDAPMMERFKMSARFADYPRDDQLELPPRFITRATSVTYLDLHGIGINWSLFPALQNLKTFKMISFISSHLQPSMAQVLCLLSRNPLLECLSVKPIDDHQWISSLQGAERVHMEYLKHIEVACKDLPMIASFFDHLTFPKGHKFRTLDFTTETVDDSCTVLQQLCQKMDNTTEGSIGELSVHPSKLECLKPQEQLVPKRLAIKLPVTSYRGSNLLLVFRMAVLRSLRLDQVIILVMNFQDDADVWSLLGNLPHVKELKVFYSEEASVTALCPKDQAAPPFPALTRLTIIFWKLGTPIQHISSTLERDPGTVGEALLNCIKLRTKAKLPLEEFSIIHCAGAKTLDLFHLNKLIDEVRWDGYDKAQDTPNPKKTKIDGFVPANLEPDIPGSAADVDGWTKVEKRKQKKTKKAEMKLDTMQPKFMYNNAEIVKRNRAIGIDEIRQLVVHIIADAPPPNWLRIENAPLIQKVVAVLIPGLTHEALLLPPIPTSATVNPNIPISIPLLPRTPEAGPPPKIPFIAATFSHACPTRAPGDSYRMHSVLSSFFHGPVSGEERNKRATMRLLSENVKNQDPEQYLLTLEQMIENEYPIPSYMADVFEKPEGWHETPEPAKAGLLDSVPEKGHTAAAAKIYAMDCEMCLTEDGKELTRVSIIDYHTDKVVYDQLVKPTKPIVDYLTRWSGITAEALAPVTTTLAQVQTHVMRLLSPPPKNPFSTSTSTPSAPPPTPILLGHSLESDLKALKICHPCCIDTALLYHHPRGRPLKPGLAWLTKKWCGREIQTRGEGGHDPEEDARACMSLLKKKLESPPGFGEFKTDMESIFERMGRSTRRAGGAVGSIRSAVVDHGNPSVMHGNKAHTSLGCSSDAEVIKGLLEAVPSHDFVFGRFMALADAMAWTTPKASQDAPAPPPPEEAAPEQLEIIYETLNTQLKTLHASLPPRTALMIFTGHSDPRRMAQLNARKAEFDKAIRSGKTAEEMDSDIRWSASDMRDLEGAVELAKRGLLFLGIKQ
ncbi:hypothetical protein H0H92_004368 [Tricholoma furcatifolium]|nr:hypothetical protein H0H92_004368 [Tricholoma furcatifolium]